MKKLPFFSYSRFKMLFPKALQSHRIKAIRLFLNETDKSKSSEKDKSNKSKNYL